MPTATFPIGQTEISLVVTDVDGLSSEPDVTTVTVSVIEVAIDIKPGSYPNSINMGSHGVVPVAFLTDSAIDATTIDPLSVTLRGEDFADGLVKLKGKKDASPMTNEEDVDGDHERPRPAAISHSTRLCQGPAPRPRGRARARLPRNSGR